MWQYSASRQIIPLNVEHKKSLEKKIDDRSNEIKGNPNNAEIYLDRARAYQSLGLYSNALEDLSIAMRLDPQNSFFYLYLRHLQHIYMGNLNHALDDIKKAVSIANHKGSDYFKCLAYVYHQLGDIDNAINALNDGIKKYPDEALPYLRRAAFYEGLGRFQQAIEDVTQAINMSPSSWSYYHDRVSIYLRTHQYEEALKDCNECVESNPKEWTHYRLRSEVYEAMGKSENARWDYYTSMDLNPVINR